MFSVEKLFVAVTIGIQQLNNIMRNRILLIVNFYIRLGDFNLTKKLIDSGLNIDTEDQFGETALTHAILSGNVFSSNRFFFLLYSTLD